MHARVSEILGKLDSRPCGCHQSRPTRKGAKKGKRSIPVLLVLSALQHTPPIIAVKVTGESCQDHGERSRVPPVWVPINPPWRRAPLLPKPGFQDCPLCSI